MPSIYSLAKFKSFTGMEGYGFNADLLQDGKKVAFARDSGDGGCMHIDWVNPTAKQLFTDFAKAEYVKNDGHSKHVALMAEIGVATAKIEPETDRDIAESHINKMVDDLQLRKSLMRWSKTKTCFQLVGDADGTYRQMMAPYTPAIEAQIRAKYGDKVKMVFNPAAE